MSDKIFEFIKNNDVKNLALLLNDKKTEISYSIYEALEYASILGHLEIVELFLSDDRIDPSFNENNIIFQASLHNQLFIVLLLFKNKYVKNTLEEDQPSLFHNLINFEIKMNIKNF